MAMRILVVEDDPKMRRLVTRALQLAGYEVNEVADGLSALMVFNQYPFDLVLLDLMIPGLDGFSVCARLREQSNVSIIILTALDQEGDKVRGLDAGADDYLTKPFGVDELQARVRAVLRRAERPRARAQAPLTVGALTIDFANQRVLRQAQEIPLTSTEYRLLASMASRANELRPHGDLLQEVWGPGYRNDVHLLQVNIARLRRKLQDEAENRPLIRTRPGVGYVFDTADGVGADSP